MQRIAVKCLDYDDLTCWPESTMQTWTIDFQEMDGSRRLRGAIEERIAGLAKQYDAIATCRVVAKGPRASKRPGLHEVDICLTLADGGEIRTGRSRGIDKRYEEIDFAIDDTFRRVRRRLQDHLSGRSGKGRRRKSESRAPAPSHGAPAPSRSAAAPSHSAAAAVPVAASPQGSSASAEAPAHPASPPPAASSPVGTPDATVGDDAGRDQAALTRDPGPGPLATEAVASNRVPPPPAGEAAAGGSLAASADAAVPPAAEPAQTPSLNPLFVAFAVGTALAAAATLNASATWARLLKSAAEGKSPHDDDLGADGEARGGAGGDHQAGSD